MIRSTINFDVETEASRVVSGINFSIKREELTYNHLMSLSRERAKRILKRIYKMRTEIDELGEDLKRSLEAKFLRTVLVMAENDLIKKFKFNPKRLGLNYNYKYSGHQRIIYYSPTCQRQIRRRTFH